MGRVMGLDIGEKRIGVAVSDAMKVAANPVAVIQRRSQEKDMARIKEYVEEYSCECIVAGLPFNMDGKAGKSAMKTISFIDALRERAGVPVKLRDERLSTVASEKVLIQAGCSREKRKKVVDKVAAAYVLQAYLDENGENRADDKT